MGSLGVTVSVTFYDTAQYDATTGEVYDAHRQLTIPNAQRGLYALSRIDDTHIQQGDFPLYVMTPDLNGYEPKTGTLVEIGNDKFKAQSVRARGPLTTIQLRSAT